jgi:hypothetical protein
MQDIATIPFRDVRHLAPIPSRSRVKMAYIPGEDRADLFSGLPGTGKRKPKGLFVGIIAPFFLPYGF